MPKFYCEYCGVYLTHSSPSGRKQHCRGRKHINNKIEYYNQLLIDQNQAGVLSSGEIKLNPFNPFSRPVFNSIPTAMPGMMPNFQTNLPNVIPAPHINLPGILPSNITSMGGGMPAPPMNMMGLPPNMMPGKNMFLGQQN